jgi:type I restriction enzyme S subunit
MEVAEQKKLKVPKLRFREFEGGWKMNRIDSIFTIFNGYAFSSLDATTDGCRWVKIADVGINEMRSDSPSFLPVQFRDNHPKYVLHQGDYVIALTRPILGGKLKIAQINEQYDGALLNQRVGRVDSTNDKGFVYAILQRHSIVSRMESRIAGSDPPNLSPNEIGSLRTHIPTLPEQQKIAGFLSAVDEKLKHLNRKKELLQQYKKGVMQKLFSQELRFKREDGSDYEDWEEMRVDEVVVNVPTKKYQIQSSQISNEGLYPVVDQGQKIVAGYHNDSSKLLRHNGVIVFGDHTTSMKYIDFDFVIGADGTKVFSSEDHHLPYIYHNLCWNNVEQEGYKRHYSILKEKFLQIPCIQEQHKIAAFLSSLDRKMDAVSAQIELTQQFKKGLLQEMFV